MKKIVWLIAAVTMLNTLSFAEFSDIDNSHWGYEAVEKMAQVEILSGYPDGSFKPSKIITLGEYASIFSKFFNIEENIVDNYFIDVDKNHWSKGKIEAIREYIQPQYDSIAEGLDNYALSTEYGIKDDLPITREIVIYSLSSILGFDNANYFKDEAKMLFADYDKILFPDAALALYKNNIISGEIIDGKVYIKPERYITRVEISSMFAKLLNEGKKISNIEGAQVFEEILNTLESLNKECKLNEAKNYLYDTKDRLDSIDFDSIITKDIKTMISKYCDKLKLEVVECGYYSYNKAYVKIRKTAYDYDSIAKKVTLDDLTTEHVKNILNDMTKNYKKLKVIETEKVIDFIKTSDGWKIVL